MKHKLLLLLLVASSIMISSCGNSLRSLFEKSDKDKAEEFIKTLDKDANVLLVLPPSDSVCVFFVQKNLIKYHNVETDSTVTIPYMEGIDEEKIENILAGKMNIMVVTQDDNDNIAGVFVYDVKKRKFSKLNPCPRDLIVVDIKVSKSRQDVIFTCDASSPEEFVPAPIDSTACDEDYSMPVDNYDGSAAAYYKHVITCNFDGKILKDKKIKVSLDEVTSKCQTTDEEAWQDNDTGYHLYVWQCSKCGKTIESMEQPAGPGCDLSKPHSNPSSWHMWEKIGQVR